MKSTNYSLSFAILVVCVVSGGASAATPAPCREGVKAPPECAGKAMSPYGPSVVLDGNAVTVVSAEVSANPSLDDYLEWHGRVAVGSALSVLMPWAALHQNAN